MYAQYTRVFGTCKEPQKSIKFSPFYRGRGPQKILLCFWGEGANEQKTNKRKKEFVCSKERFATRTRLRTNPSRTPFGVPTRYCVLVGLNGIKILPFWGRYNLIKFSPFWGEFFMSLRSTALRCCGNPPEGNHITNPRKIFLYSRGKGAHKQKSEHYRPR